MKTYAEAKIPVGKPSSKHSAYADKERFFPCPLSSNEHKEDNHEANSNCHVNDPLVCHSGSPVNDIDPRMIDGSTRALRWNGWHLNAARLSGGLCAKIARSDKTRPMGLQRLPGD
ncbi:MAG: hypothetical protein OXH52_15420 [Gammaproteobacteria bacterium]|nr:hypothetical protein [Gammaproteobacteria bacterium]